MGNLFNDIGNKDSGQLDLSGVSLQTQYTKLTMEEKELVFLKLHGFTNRPPEIEQLYTDPYYLGGPEFYSYGTMIFDFWKKGLKEIFPGMMTRYPYLCLSGAIGIGKSVISKVCMAMTYARLGCMANPYATFKLAPKPMSFVVFHKSEETADIEFKRWFEREVLQFSPFFKNIPNKHKIKIICSGPRGAGGLGSDVIFAIMGEINFWDNEEKAMERVNSTLIRFKSRYSLENLQLAGQFIIDSSARGASGPTEVFLENTDPAYTWNCAPPHYEVRPDMYRTSKGQTCAVYKGDGRIAPQILDPEAPIPQDMDPDRVIRPPLQLLGDFKADIYKALQDLCGVSTGSSNSFFNGNISHLVNCMKSKNLMEETLVVDFFDREENLMDQVKSMTRLIPRNTFLWVGLDLAVAKDTTGIAAVSFDHWEEIGGTKVPFFKSYFIFGVTRITGQETSLFHVYQFLKMLSEEFQILVSADQAFSKSILQDLERDSIRTRYLSTDRSPEMAIFLKNIINREQIDLPLNLRLQREASDLRVMAKGKVDHPKKASLIIDNKDGKLPGSKDIWDALSSALYSCHLSVVDGEEGGSGTTYQRQTDIISNMNRNEREDTQKTFQNLLEGIF